MPHPYDFIYLWKVWSQFALKYFISLVKPKLLSISIDYIHEIYKKNNWVQQYFRGHRECKFSIQFFVYHFMFHQSLFIMCMIAFHFKLQLFYFLKKKTKQYQNIISSNWWNIKWYTKSGKENLYSVTDAPLSYYYWICTYYYWFWFMLFTLSIRLLIITHHFTKLSC